jgi:hypothetical protein
MRGARTSQYSVILKEFEMQDKSVSMLQALYYRKANAFL